MTFGCIQTARRYYRRIINGRQSVDGRPDSVQMMPPQMTTLQSDIIRSPPSPVTDVHDDFGRDSSFRSFFSSEIASSARLHLHNMPRKYGNFHPPEAVGFLRKVGRFLSSRRQYFYRLNGVVLSQHKTKESPCDEKIVVVGAKFEPIPDNGFIMDLGYTCHIFYADDVYQRKLWLESLTLASEYSIERFLDLGSTIGNGCCSDVHIAKDRQSGSLVAVKSISKDEHSDKRIKREGSIMRKMHSRHVLGTLGTFDSVKHFHIVMPYMSGGSLLDKMIEKRNIFNEADVRDLMRQVLSGLAYIHAKGVVHRDLKPDNILLHGKAPFQVRIADFGMSIFHNPLDPPMRNVVGNPLFMAPEIWKRSGYGKEIDLWSLGVIMYTMLSGKYPLHLRQILNRVYKSWNITYNDVEWGHISEEAKSLNRMLLCADPSRRVSAAGALEHQWFSNAVIDVGGVSLPDIAAVGRTYSNARVINMDACAIRQRIRTNLRTFRVCVHALRFLHRMAVKHERGGSKTKKVVVHQSTENANVEPRMSEVKREMQTMLNAFLIGQSKSQRECIENVVCRWSGAYRTS